MVEAFLGFKKTPFSDCPDAKLATQARSRSPRVAEAGRDGDPKPQAARRKMREQQRKRSRAGDGQQVHGEFAAHGRTSSERRHNSAAIHFAGAPADRIRATRFRSCVRRSHSFFGSDC